VRVGLNVREPVEENGDLFGATVQLAARLCEHAGPGQILLPSSVRQLVAGKDFTFSDPVPVSLRGITGAVDVQEVRWSEPEDAESAAALPAPPADDMAAAPANVFRREGEDWTVGYDGVVSRFRDAKGFRYL